MSNFIVVTDFTHGRILQVDFQTGTVIKLPITANRSPGLVLEKSTTTLFYCETFTKSIKYTTLQGDNTTYFYTTSIQFKPFILRKCICQDVLVWQLVSYPYWCLFLYITIFVYYRFLSCEAVSGTLKVVIFVWEKFTLARRKA